MSKLKPPLDNWKGNSCQSSPCPSNATCQTGFTAEGYRCICPQGYKGDHCEEDIDECEDNSHTCKPYADCCNLIGSYRCICKPDYIGDGINCTGQPPRAVDCVSLTISQVTNSYEVNADHGTWPADGFCRVLPEMEINAGDSYTMTVELMNVIGSGGVHSGHPGVVYNVIDENNFDSVYFRSVSLLCCYQTGYLSNGQYVWGLSAACPNGSPSGGVWFTVRVEVSSDKSVNIFLNNDLVTSYTANFVTKGRGGVLVANGYKNIIQFKKFSVASN
ncbi:putative skeletal organic matrix protein 7 [Oculina patagonica]